MKNNGKHRAKRVKLPLRAYLLYLLVASFLMTGVTFSKYIAASTGGDSARVATIQELRIDESGSNGLTTADKGKWVVIPGVPLEKEAKVIFGGSEAATYVFVKLSVSDEWQIGTDNMTYTVSDNGTELMSFAVADGWTYLLTATDGSRVYVYTEDSKNILAPNTALNEAVIKDGTITVTEDVTEANIAETASSITLRAYAVQSSGFAGAQDAWNSVFAKTN